MKNKIIDTGDNQNLEIIIDGKKIDLTKCVGYELERIAGKSTKVKIIYEINELNLKIEDKKNFELSTIDGLKAIVSDDGTINKLTIDENEICTEIKNGKGK